MFRTSNVSTLEEKNIALFLSHVEKELGIRREKIFKKRGDQVLGKFADFHIFLAGLALVSKKLEKNLDVKSFDSTSIETKTNYQDDDQSKIYENTEVDENNHYDNLYSTQIQEIQKTTSLNSAVTVLL